MNTMPNTLLRLAAALALLSVGFTAEPAGAAGLSLYEIGSPDLATASAGRAALALDASTAAWNPAGMTRLDHSQLVAGAQVLLPTIEFDSGAGTTVVGNNGGNAGSPTPSLGSFYVHSFSDRFKMGAALSSFYGLAGNYANNWVGRYTLLNAEIFTIGLITSAAYRVNDWLSIGAGPGVFYGRLKSTTGINNVQDALPDGKLKVNADDIALNANAGILVELNEHTRFGVAYNSKVELDYDDRPNFKDLGPGLEAILGASGVLDAVARLGLPIPQGVVVSGYHDLTERLAVVANVGWQDWSDFGSIELSLDDSSDTSVTTALNTDDTYHGALGFRFRIADPWLVSIGAAYDTSPMSVQNRSLALPMDRQVRYGTGIEYTASERYRFGLAYEFLDLGNAKVSRTGGPLSGDVQGDYGSNYVSFVLLTVTRTF
jgi:long-chain fatty acid transport protein